MMKGKRPRGRPRNRGKDSIEVDLEILVINNWEEKAKSRDECGRVISTAMNLKFSES
uniref:Uncharacterized protein n=1 Tax=Arion vulgaris TaxID=1028688 RepID=A0A0B7AAJ0_9EUPU